MLVNSRKHNDHPLIERFAEVKPPVSQVFFTGSDPLEWLNKPKLAVVGSRKYSAYGQQVTEQLVAEAVRAGVVIISGMALGLDSIAHRTALQQNGTTVAVLPGSVEDIYPRSHYSLATRIAGQGTLFSEYPPGSPIKKYHFIARNRLIAALADAVLVPEASLKSGSLHTAQFALELGRTVLAVPADITRVNSQGTNNLIKQGALAVTEPQDILMTLGITSPRQIRQPAAFNPHERLIIDALEEGHQEANQLLLRSRLSAPLFFSTMTALEIQGHIVAIDGSRWARKM